MSHEAPHRCPVCLDASEFVFWLEPNPPPCCPYDKQGWAGGERTVTNVTQCSFAMGKAKAAAHRRKCCPEGFDENGNIKPGMAGEVFRRAMETPMA
jgi:hypothetical protein